MFKFGALAPEECRAFFVVLRTFLSVPYDDGPFGQTQDQLKELGEAWAAAERVGSAANQEQVEKAATLESEVSQTII